MVDLVKGQKVIIMATCEKVVANCLKSKSMVNKTCFDEWYINHKNGAVTVIMPMECIENKEFEIK